MSCCLRITPPLAPPPRVVVEVLEEAWAISSNPGIEAVAAEDGPWFSGRSVLLGSMLRPPRHRRWPHRGRSLLLANPPRTALEGHPVRRARTVRSTDQGRSAVSYDYRPQLWLTSRPTGRFIPSEQTRS